MFLIWVMICLISVFLEKVGLKCCPNDAVEEVQEVCNFKSSINGGRGAVRELCDFILDAQGIEKIATVSEGKNS